MKIRRSTLFSPLSIFIDTVCLNISFLIAYFIRFGSFENVFKPPYLLLYVVMNAFWFFLLLIVKPFEESRITFNFFKLIYKYIILLALHIALISIFWVSVQGAEYSRLQLFYTYCITFSLGFLYRGTGVFLLKYLRLHGYNIRRYAILGYGDLSRTIYNYYQQHPEMGYEFHGYYDENDTLSNVGSIEDLNNKLLDNSIDYIYCCLPYIDNNILKSIISIAEYKKCQVKLLMDFRGFATKGVSIEYHDFLPIINVHSSPFIDAKVALVKRIFDIIFSFLVLFLGLPLLVVFGLLTKLSSKGPVLFISERTGQYGKKFKMYKFRSMYVNADEIAQKLFNGKMHSNGSNDPRITTWGNFMRKTRIDELPQFFNVLIGDMSVVGPRPLAQYDVDMLNEVAPSDFERLLTLKPGITSIGQIRFGYATNSEENLKRLQYDLDYIDKYSFKLDISLILQTIKVVTTGKGK